MSRKRERLVEKKKVQIDKRKAFLFGFDGVVESGPDDSPNTGTRRWMIAKWSLLLHSHGSQRTYLDAYLLMNTHSGSNVWHCCHLTFSDTSGVRGYCICISIVGQWQGLTNGIRSVPRRAHSCSGVTQLHALALPLDTELLLKVSGVRLWMSQLSRSLARKYIR